MDAPKSSLRAGCFTAEPETSQQYQKGYEMQSSERKPAGAQKGNQNAKKFESPEFVQIRVETEEKASWKATAKARGENLGSWIRATCNNAIK